MNRRRSALADQRPAQRARLTLVRFDTRRLPLPPGDYPRGELLAKRTVRRWWDTTAFGLAISVSLIVGVVLVAMAMEWVTL